MYSVAGSLFRTRAAAIRAAVEWWGTACGTQPMRPDTWTEADFDALRGWCAAPDGVDQHLLDEEVLAYAREVARAAR